MGSGEEKLTGTFILIHPAFDCREQFGRILDFTRDGRAPTLLQKEIWIFPYIMDVLDRVKNESGMPFPERWS